MSYYNREGWIEHEGKVYVITSQERGKYFVSKGIVTPYQSMMEDFRFVKAVTMDRVIKAIRRGDYNKFVKVEY
jgi:hypothetical protein